MYDLPTEEEMAAHDPWSEFIALALLVGLTFLVVGGFAWGLSALLS